MRVAAVKGTTSTRMSATAASRPPTLGWDLATSQMQRRSDCRSRYARGLSPERAGVAISQQKIVENCEFARNCQFRFRHNTPRARADVIDHHPRLYHFSV